MPPKKMLPGASVVFTDPNGQHMVMLQDGSVMQAVISTEVMDAVNERAKVTILAFCNLATDEEHAKQIIEQWQKERNP